LFVIGSLSGHYLDDLFAKIRSIIDPLIASGGSKFKPPGIVLIKPGQL